MLTAITIVHIFACVFLVLVILIQAGKGADISASLGGSSQTIFGSSGGANFFTRFTAVVAGIFMLTSLGLTYLGNQTKRSIFEGMTAPVSATAPVAGADAPKAAAATETAPATTTTAPATTGAAAPTAPAAKSKK